MAQERTDVWLGEVDDTPTDAEIPSGKTVVYLKSGDGSLYKRPEGGSESEIGGGGPVSVAATSSETISSGGFTSTNTGLPLANATTAYVPSITHAEGTTSSDDVQYVYSPGTYIGFTWYYSGETDLELQLNMWNQGASEAVLRWVVLEVGLG